MSFTDKLVYLFLSLVTLSLIGALTGSWRLILYPYLIVIGVAILFGILKNLKKQPKLIWIPIVVSVTFLVLFGWLDILTLNSPTGGEGYIFGLTPSMALYILLIWPALNIICLLYAFTFKNDEAPN